MTDEYLKKYLTCKVDRIAAKAFARGDENKILRMQENLHWSKACENVWEFQICPMSRIRMTKGWRFLRRNDTQFQENAKQLIKQAEVASKPDRALVVGFAIYEPTHEVYRQIRAPLGGGIPYLRELQDAKKDELIIIITPLFIPGGKKLPWKNGRLYFWYIDWWPRCATHARWIYTMLRLGLKRFRCYLLARCKREDSLIIDKEIS